MISVQYLLAYFKEHPDYEVKNVKNTDYNIEYCKSVKRRKNVLVELYPASKRFYLYKDGQWVNINKLAEIKTDSEVIAWVEKDAEYLSK